MNGKKIFAIGVLSVILFAVVAVMPASAANENHFIERGEIRGWFLDPGDTLTVYYYSDGDPFTVAWKNNWFYWWENDPTTFIEVYCGSEINGQWNRLYSSSLAPWYRSYNPQMTCGMWKFYIKNYRNGDMPYLKIY